MLTLHDRIRITVGNLTFHMDVKQMAPGTVCCLVDSSPKVEFEEALYDKTSSERREEYVDFNLDEPAHGLIKKDQMMYFRFKIVDINMAIEFNLDKEKEQGDADLFVSTSTRPTPSQYDFRSLHVDHDRCLFFFAVFLCLFLSFSCCPLLCLLLFVVYLSSSIYTCSYRFYVSFVFSFLSVVVAFASNQKILSSPKVGSSCVSVATPLAHVLSCQLGRFCH